MQQAQLDWLKVAFCYGVGPVNMLKLVRQFGSATEVLVQDQRSLEQVVTRGVAQSILSQASLKEVDAALSWQAKDPKKRKLITLNSDEYPAILAEINTPPMVLFGEGNWNLLQQPKIAVVGTRHPTAQGRQNAFAFAHELAAHGLVVVSGMALGVDRAAHEGALSAAANSTIAVLGTGIDLIYPANHRELYQQISANGLLVSEFQLATPAISTNFPRRNRIVVGLSLGCLVVESAEDGGSMISANLAGEYGRELMAIPGSIHNPMARGCHKLIRQGAKLVETVADIMEELPLSHTKANQHKKPEQADPFLAYLGYEPIAIDVLCTKLNLEFAEICGKLLELELAGLVVNCGDGRYQRIFK
jgi:DNA processing protein